MFLRSGNKSGYTAFYASAPEMNWNGKGLIYRKPTTHTSAAKTQSGEQSKRNVDAIFDVAVEILMDAIIICLVLTRIKYVKQLTECDAEDLKRPSSWKLTRRHLRFESLYPNMNLKCFFFIILL